MDSAGVESSMLKEAKEELVKRSEMAEMRSEVPRHAEEIRKMERQRRGCLLGINENFASKEATLLVAGMDSAGGESSMRKEAKEESGKRSEMQYEWMKRPEESEASYERRLRLLKEHERSANGEERRKDAMGPARGLRREALGQAGRLARDNNIARPQRETNSKEKARTKPKVDANDAESGKAKPPVTEAGKPEESVTEAGKAEESLTVGSGKSAMNQEVIGLNCTDNEILKQEFKYKLDRGGNSFIQEKERRAMLKALQERLTRRKKSSFHWLHKLPTKDEESGKAEAPVTEAGKPEESAMDQEVIADDKKSLEQVRKDKLDIMDLEEDSRRMTGPAADPNSMTIQDDHVDRGKSALAEKTADEEEKDYASFRKDWESDCCNDCDHFEQITMLGPMQYTHYTPGIVPCSVAETLQIFSMKLKLTDDNAGGFKLPLSVYGMVAVRDTLDSRRNILFSCNRTVAQELTQDDPFLLLTGPSRAIVSMDKVYFEIYLRVKGAAASQDKPLMTRVGSYLGGSGTALCFGNVMCKLELCLRTVKPAVQATIVCVQIVKKKELWPTNFTYGGLVACTPLPRTTADSDGNQKIVLIESKGRKMPQGDIGYVHLRRQVVSVEGGGVLDVVIQAYEKSGAVAAEGHIHFRAQNCHVSQRRCTVGQAQVNVTVAWSVVPTHTDDVVYND